MRGVVIAVFVLCMLHAVASQRSAASLRNALSINPIFSHVRENQVPQNVNIETPVVVQESAASHTAPEVVHQREPSQRNRNSPPRARPSRQPEPPRQNNQRRPIQVVPTQASARQPPQQAAFTPAINDRMADRVQTNRPNRGRTPPRRQPEKCSFTIPSFLFTDLNMTQTEFEQQYLIPALRAHVRGGSCRTRSMTIYLDWLLHLRERLFGV